MISKLNAIFNVAHNYGSDISLVHFYILVTAGVYLIIRFNRIIIIISKLNLGLLFTSIFTMIISEINALYECLISFPSVNEIRF